MGKKTRIVLTSSMELVEAASSEAAVDKAGNIGHPRDASFTPENIGHPRGGVFVPENIGHPRVNPGGPSALEFAEARVVRRISASQDDEGNIFLDLEE